MTVAAEDAAAGTVARRRMTSGELAIWRSLIDTTAELRTILGAQLQEIGPLAGRLPGAAGAERGGRPAAALIGAGGEPSTGSAAGCPITSGGWSGAA